MSNKAILFYASCLQIARNMCCSQGDDIGVKGKIKVCEDLGCIYEKCGWKKDGWEDDSYGKDDYDEDDKAKWGSGGYSTGKYGDDKAKWGSGGYNKDKYDDDKYDDDKAKWGSGGYSTGKYDDDKGDYDDDYAQMQKYFAEKKYAAKDYDDECTSDERETCCTAEFGKRGEICMMLGCNINKVSTNILTYTSYHNIFVTVTDLVCASICCFLQCDKKYGND